MTQFDLALNQPLGNSGTQMQQYKIGEAIFCPLQRRILIGDGAHILEPMVSKLLEVLIAAEQPVSRKSLLDEIWGKDGSDEAITQAVSKLRRALGDTTRPYKMIETLPKQGYQLRAPVKLDQQGGVDATNPGTISTINRLSAKLPKPSRFMMGLGIGAGGMLVGTIAFIGLFGARSNEVEIECPINASGEECLALVQAVVGRE